MLGPLLVDCAEPGNTPGIIGDGRGRGMERRGATRRDCRKKWVGIIQCKTGTGQMGMRDTRRTKRFKFNSTRLGGLLNVEPSFLILRSSRESNVFVVGWWRLSRWFCLHLDWVWVVGCGVVIELEL